MSIEMNEKKEVNKVLYSYHAKQSLSKVPDESQNNVIVLRNVHKTYLLGIEGISALRGVNLAIKEKEFVCIFGTSGGGKTTLLNIMGTIDKPTKGEVVLCGHKIKSSTEDKILAGLRLSYIGFVFQTFNLIGSLTALENVELPMILKGELSKAEIKKRATDLLEKVGLGARLNHFPNQLSGGEQQRVTIARSLANKPKIMQLYEPTGDLDTKNTDLVMNILLDLNLNEGITMIMVTHDVSLKNFANKVVRILDGKIQKIEEIDPEIRKNAINELKDTIANEYDDKNILIANNLGVREGTHHHGKQFPIEEKKEEDKGNIEEGEIKGKEGHVSIKMEGKKSIKTEKRSPFDYPAIAMYINDK